MEYYLVHFYSKEKVFFFTHSSKKKKERKRRKYKTIYNEKQEIKKLIYVGNVPRLILKW